MNQHLAQLGRQLLGIWKQLGLNQRISVVLAAAVVLVALFSLAFWSSREDYALLYGRLDDAEAAKVVDVIEAAKVPYKIGQGGGTIYVPRDKVHTLRMQLASKGIPRGDGVGFEIFDRPNFGISDFVQRANYLRALQGELSRTIGQLDEVEAARVMVVLPENRLLVDNQKRPTASVFVRTKGHVQLPPSAVNSIRFLVANSVEGLQPSAVTVVDNRGNVLTDNLESDSLAGMTSNQLSMRRNLEQYLAKKAEGMLEAVLGPGQAVVRVAAEINLDQVAKVEEKFDPESQVVRSSTINDEDTDTTSASNGSMLGGASNMGGDPTTNSVPTNASRTKKKVTNNQYEISRVTSNITQMAGGLKRVSAAVFIAARQEGAGAERKVAPRSKEELDKLRRIVQTALGIPLSGDSTVADLITLEEMPFNDQVGEVAQDLGNQAQRQFWWNQAQTFLYPVLALGVLAIFWRVLKRTPVEQMPAPAETPWVPGTASPAMARVANAQGFGPPTLDLRRGTGADPNAEVFAQMLRENPGNVSQALQTWLARGRSNQP